jgi:hypothetical protein
MLLPALAIEHQFQTITLPSLLAKPTAAIQLLAGLLLNPRSAQTPILASSLLARLPPEIVFSPTSVTRILSSVSAISNLATPLELAATQRKIAQCIPTNVSIPNVFLQLDNALQFPTELADSILEPIATPLFATTSLEPVTQFQPMDVVFAHVLALTLATARTATPATIVLD